MKNAAAIAHTGVGWVGGNSNLLMHARDGKFSLLVRDFDHPSIYVEVEINPQDLRCLFEFARDHGVLETTDTDTVWR